MKGYELARADIERRGNGDDAATVGKKPSLFAALFRAASRTTRTTRAPALGQEREARTGQRVRPRNPPIRFRRRRANRRSSRPSSWPGRRADRPAAQRPSLAGEQKQAAPGFRRAETADAGRYHQFPRLLGRRTGTRRTRLPPPRSQPCAHAGARRRHRSAADRQRHRIVQQGDGLCPAADSPVDRANVVAATRRSRAPDRPARNAGAAATESTPWSLKGAQGQDAVVATSARLAAARGDNIWMRGGAGAEREHAMSTTVLGDTEMTQMRSHFVKPQAAIAMTFSEDPMMGMTCDRFTGSATAQLPTQSFVLRTAALR